MIHLAGSAPELASIVSLSLPPSALLYIGSERLRILRAGVAASSEA